MVRPAEKLIVDKWHPELKKVAENISKVIVGKEDVIWLLLIALLAGGHCLIEDVPGVGKTMLVRAAARTLGCEFKRIQFTPDLLPSDVTGVSIYNQMTHDFEFRQGPIFGQVILADEINRTSPKTQSALLESLEEGHVTADGVTYRLPQPFCVLATENPIEFEGTFSLPEAQLDRFLLKLSIGYPTIEDEVEILSNQQVAHPIESLQQVATPEDVIRWKGEVSQVSVQTDVKRYIVQLIQSTRHHQHVYLGASPRASIALFKAAQAHAFLSGRSYVIPDDVRYLAPYIIEHRILLSADSLLSGVSVHDVISKLLDQLPVPMLQGAAYK